MQISPNSFNYKSVQFFFIFLICRLVQFYLFLIFSYLQISPLVLFLQKGPKVRIQSKCHAGSPSPGGAPLLVQRHTWQPIKGHPLYQSEGSHRYDATSLTDSYFSLSIQLDQKSQKLRKLKNNFANPSYVQKQI